MAALVLLKSPGAAATGEELKLEGTSIVIGRSPEDCQLVIPGNAVSRKHAQITFSGGDYFIEDLRSRNKTYLNSKEVVARTALKHGDRIKICDFLFTFKDERVPPPRPPLPEDIRRLPPEPEPPEPENTTTIEATLTRTPPQQFLETQPTDKLRILLKISSALSKTLQLDSLLPQIADELFDLFKQADRCFLIQCDERGEQLMPRLVKTRRYTPGAEQFSRTIVRTCLKNMQAILSEDASDDRNFGLAHSIAEFRIRSVMCVPLATQDNKPLGVIQLDNQDRTKKFTQEDLKLLMAVANQAALSLENARLHESLVTAEKNRQEVELARQVQMGFLPQTFPDVPDYEFFAHYIAAHTVGGDYYDFIPLADGRQAVLLGDVSGKGVPAALLMAKLSAEARFCILSEPDPVAAIGRLNNHIAEVAARHDRYVTLAAAVLDPARHRVTLVNAGHMSPLVLRPAEGTLEEAVTKDQSGFALGWVPGYEYEPVTVELLPGDSLLLYTDGIPDAEGASGAKFSMDGLRRALAVDAAAAEVLTPGLAGRRLVDAVQAHAAGRPQFDDIALVCFGRVDAPGHLAAATGSGELPSL